MNTHPELELMVYVFIEQKTTCKVGYPHNIQSKLSMACDKG
jgi:hypothetical protein